MELAPARNPVDQSSTSNATINVPTELVQGTIDDPISTDPLAASYPSNQSITTAEATTASTAGPPNNETESHSAHPPEPRIPDSIETISSSLPNEYNVKRPVLDESGSSLKSVLDALESLNTDTITNCAIPGKYDMLTNTDPAVFAKIISSVGINCVQSCFASMASALVIEKERIRGHQQNRLTQIKEGRKHMAMFSAARTKKEECLRQETEAAIGRLSMRELADRELNHIFSEPAELLGEFKEEDEFENLIKEIDKENASDKKRQGRAAVKETYYWPIIQRRANQMGHLSEPPGRRGGLMAQEKYTAKKLVLALGGYGHSTDSIRKARSYLKMLSDLREAGVTLLLLYRTKEFKT